MWKVGVDIGGTFTDLVMVDEETGEYVSVKAAREKYGVIMDPATKEVDIKETLNHRNRKSEPIRS